MRSTAFLGLIAALALTAVQAQTGEDADSLQTPQDSLQVEEETEVVPEIAGEVTEEVPETPEDGAEVDPQTAEEVTVEDVEEVHVPGQPTAVLESFFQSLKEGDSYMVSQLISEEGLDNIDVMLEILKENLDDNPEAVMSRLSTAGYSATADEVEDWSPMEYLLATVELPVMKARYSMYEMRISDFTVTGDRLQVPMAFITSSGVELPFQAELVKVRNDWKVSTFMGLNSFP
ncbi:MAG: hypothetical protein JXA64_02390 [Candidatus Fermentibacteraceae bacterium]|nr:hypothetical protein [Candidatus Fermentibacteraceae bacterium]MBN2607936.1 hypothetical protein [Candidatus Fermentibacteraceae bacterium]